MKKFSLYIWSVIVSFIPFLARAADSLPAGNPITFDFIDYLAALLLNFIIGLSMTLMIGFIVASGIMIMGSRDNPNKYGKALAMLRSAIIGSAVILGSGVIINTIWSVVTRDFFCQVSVLGICIFN